MTVYTRNQIEGLVLIRDGALMIADGANKILETTEPKEETKEEKPTLDEISSLKYVDKTSDKGPYKTASLTDNPNNPAFLKLQKFLKEHNNFAILCGFKLWSFSSNPNIIGRRKQ